MTQLFFFIRTVALDQSNIFKPRGAGNTAGSAVVSQQFHQTSYWETNVDELSRLFHQDQIITDFVHYYLLSNQEIITTVQLFFELLCLNLFNISFFLMSHQFILPLSHDALCSVADTACNGCNYAYLLFFLHLFVKTSLGLQICLLSFIVLLNIMCLGIKCICNVTLLFSVESRRWCRGAIGCT